MVVRSQSSARALAQEVRRSELALTDSDPLDPYVLAELYGIRIIPLTTVVGLPAATAGHFSSPVRANWSAALVPVGTARFILDNDHHPVRRRRASIAHEMSHLLWEHEFSEVLLTADGCRAADPGLEEEADRLAHELMVPSPAAHDLAKRGWPDTRVAELYQVSVDYARMRMDRSGARRHAAYAAAKANRT